MLNVTFFAKCYILDTPVMIYSVPHTQLLHISSLFNRHLEKRHHMQAMLLEIHLSFVMTFDPKLDLYIKS